MIDILCTANSEADPAAIGENVVRLRFSGGDKFVTYGRGKGDVYQMVAVNVADFPAAIAVFRAPETMGNSRHSFPL